MSVALARERKQEEKVLFPIRLDKAVMDIKEGWAANIRDNRYIGDFTNWQDDEVYKAAFERLLDDLAEGDGEQYIIP